MTKLKSIVFLSLMLFIGCTNKIVRPPKELVLAPIIQPKKEVHMVVVPQNGRTPAQILVNQSERYQFNTQGQNSFKRELLINPLMHDASVKAQVMKGNKVVREYAAVKNIQTIMSENKTTWTASRARLSLSVPFIAPNEELVIKTTYSWMDPRWHWPLFLESDEPTGLSKVTIDVPFGVVMRFKASNNAEPFELMPQTQNAENAAWSKSDVRSGLGSRYIFAHDFALKNPAKSNRDKAQLFFSFDLPMQEDKSSSFNNWEAVSFFINNRIDRYDLPSNAIRDFAQKECEDKESELAKITRIMAFLRNDIEKRAAAGPYLEQEAQPATRTFARRFGSDFDTVILGKAMLTSLGIKADLVAIASKKENPRISDFYSPALFDKVILAINTDDQTFYFDPSLDNDRIDQIPASLQGQSALVIRKDKGQYFSLPYDGPEHNQTSLVYQLSLSKDGKVEGSFNLDMHGLATDELRAALAQSERSRSAPELQSHIKMNNTMWRWQTAALRDQKATGDINISGYLTPRLLKKDGSALTIAIGDLLKPSLAPLLEANTQNFSNITRVYATMSIPDGYVLNISPIDRYFYNEGVSGRYLVHYKEGILSLEGEAIVSLPLSANFKNSMSSELKALRDLGETLLPIMAENKEEEKVSEGPVENQNS